MLLLKINTIKKKGSIIILLLLLLKRLKKIFFFSKLLQNKINRTKLFNLFNRYDLWEKNNNK
jgi:hypothetical protein